MCMSNPIRCAIIGQNPMRFPWGFDEEDDRCRKLEIELAQQIMACDCGVGLYAAEIVNGLRMSDHDLMLICCTPHEEQATKWAPYLRERYFTMLEKCTLISAVCEVGAPDAQFQAYKKIIDLADVVLGVYDLESPAVGDAEDGALAYAVDTAHKSVLVLDPIKLTTFQIDEHYRPQ